MLDRSYLQWVGTRWHATIADFVEEAKQLGVSKKLPNRHMARVLARPGCVVFLVHDQGRSRTCLACAETVVCPLCQGFDTGERCPRCASLGSVEVGTGGSVLVDGERWSYSRYLKLRRKRTHEFWQEEHDINLLPYCRVCGGRGALPEGAIFGLYAPDRILYVNGTGATPPPDVGRPGAGVEVIPELAAREWPRRSGGFMLPRAFYAVAATTGDPRRELVEYVVQHFGDGGAEFYGNLAVLKEPVGYGEKLFRGLKRWEPPELVPEAPAPSILEGVV